MTGQAIPLWQMMEGPMTQLIIPVYQRNYDWKIENCYQLFDDLLKLKNSGRPTHFFGSIVSAPSVSGYDRLIIDGQQRLTTTSLLLLAAIKGVKDGIIPNDDPNRTEMVKNTFLMSTYCNNPKYKQKLLPIEKDREAYVCLFESDDSKFIEGSNITRNFRYFYQKLTAQPVPFSFGELQEMIHKLEIIRIDLQQQDDPQLIFESLNSTGLALQEADKIRNYLLMSLPADQQEKCYKNYWEKIESATAGEPTMFLRDYITIREEMQRPIKLNRLYAQWKKYMMGKNRESEMQAMLDFANYYDQVTSCKIKINGTISKNLSNKINHLGALETDVLNLFLVPFLKYATDNQMSENDIWNVLDLIENYMARRIICGLPANSLTQVCCALHRDVMKSKEEYAKANQPLDNSYAEILAYHLMRREGNYSFPSDQLVKGEMKTRDVYHMLKQYQRFLFERLENTVHKETIDVVKELKDNTATIEHIMPQTLNAAWRNSLGEEAEKIQGQWLHTLANLTLTGVNTELGNKAFEVKKEGVLVDGIYQFGYKQSKYRLTQEVTKYDNWTPTEMDLRQKELEDRFLALYPYPATKFKPLPKNVEEVSLSDEEFDPVNRMLRGYQLFGETFEEKVWINFYIRVVKALIERYPDALDSFCDKSAIYSTNEHEAYCTKVTDNRWLWTSMDNRTKIRLLRQFFDAIEELPQDSLIMYLEPLKQ